MSSKFVHESEIRLVEDAMKMSYNFQKEVVFSLEFCEKVRIMQENTDGSVFQINYDMKSKDKDNKYHNSLQRRLGNSLNS